jgi:putative transposase
VATVVRVVDRYGWICHAYVVMHNHFHLLVETPLPNLRWGCGS